MSKPKSSKEMGAKAYEYGLDIDSNPFMQGTLGRRSWFEGWLDAWGEQKYSIESLRTRFNLRKDHAKVDAKATRKQRL
jgi:hypothetical protein